jgi:putative GTP pyrophosphokinase
MDMNGEERIIYPDRKRLEEKYSERLPRLTEELEGLEKKLRELLENTGTRGAVKGRIKSFNSYYDKLLRRLAEADPPPPPDSTGEELIRDLVGVRVITPFLESVKVIEGTVREQFRVMEVERKGEDQNFREFGYQSTHLHIELPSRLVCELQIRTTLQDAWAEVEHELIYKGSFSPFDDPLKRKLAALNATLSLSDIIFQEIRDYQRKLNRELMRRRAAFEKHVELELSGTTLPQRETTSIEVQAEADLDQYLLRALEMHNKGKYAEAVKLYGEILSGELRPEIRVLNLVHRGMARFANADYSGAEKDFLEAAGMEGCTKEKRYSRSVRYYLGVLYRVTGRHREAFESFSSVLASDPYHFDSLFGASRSLFDLGDHAAAMDFCDRALTIVPDAEEVRQFRGHVAKKLGL